MITDHIYADQGIVEKIFGGQNKNQGARILES